MYLAINKEHNNNYDSESRARHYTTAALSPHSTLYRLIVNYMR